MCTAFSAFNQQRFPIAAPDTWVAVTIPNQARNVVLGLESSTATYRVSAVNTIDPATQGLLLTAGSTYSVEGQAAADVTLYVSTSAATTAVLQWTN